MLSKHSDDSRKRRDLFHKETNSPPLTLLAPHSSGTTQVKLGSCPKLSANPNSNIHAHWYTEWTRVTEAFPALASHRVQHGWRKEKKTKQNPCTLPQTAEIGGIRYSNNVRQWGLARVNYTFAQWTRSDSRRLQCLLVLKKLKSGILWREKNLKISKSSY